MRLRSFLLLLLPAALSAQASRDSVITVTASRTTRLLADRATLFLTVEGSAETAVDAVTRVETKVKAVTEAVRAFGPSAIADAPIPFTVAPAAAMNTFPAAPTPPSHIARTIIRVSLSGTDRISQLIASAINAGAAGTSALSFESSKADSVRRSRYADAVAGARMDAQVLAASLGGHLGALLEATTSSAPGFSVPSTLSFDSRFSPQVPAPEVSIVATVTVRFRLLP